MFLVGFLVDIGALPADFDGLAAVALLGRHELDAAVTVLVIVTNPRTTPPTRRPRLCWRMAGLGSRAGT